MIPKLKTCSFIVAIGLFSLPIAAQEVNVIEHRLENGLTLLLVPKPGDPNVAAGWVAKVGSVNERPGITGVAHLFEHMMFKGTKVLGTQDIDQDLDIISQLDALRVDIQTEQTEIDRQFQLGRVADPDDPRSRTPRHQKLLDDFDALLERQSELLIKEDFSRIYTGEGASGMNAGTSYDFTIYFINLPANKLELWFWMESDRLLNPVFREFYAERDVVHEERRMRTDSTPIGKFQEQFEAMFWQSSPYGWPVVGWPSDLAGITREEALSFFGTYYAPNNLAATLVGDFDPDEAIELAERYFGRLVPGKSVPQEPRTREMPQLAEKRMVAFAETNPQVVIRYHSVRDGHVDEPPLVVLGQLLNGRTGRLYKALVEEQEVATSAFGGQSGFKYEGMFELRGTAKQGRTPEEVEESIYEELERLKIELVPERELQKVKNQNAAGTFRGLRSNFGLMMQLLMRESNRGWEHINSDPSLYDAVTAEDVMRVADTYFTPETKSVAVYYRKDGGKSKDDPLLVGLSDEQQQQVGQMRAAIAQMDESQLNQFLAQLEQMTDQGPSEMQEVANVVVTLTRTRLGELGEER